MAIHRAWRRSAARAGTAVALVCALGVAWPAAATPLAHPQPRAARDAQATPGPAQVERDTHPLVSYLPLTTQVQQNGQSGIELGNRFVAAQPPASGSTQGYQVVVLGSSWSSPSPQPTFYNPAGPANPNPYVTLPVLANLFFSVASAADVSAMGKTLTDSGSYADACSSSCYVVVSSYGSAGMGFTSCPGQDSTAGGCGLSSAQPGALFTRLGGTASASYAPGDTPYSLVTTVLASGSTVTFPGEGGGTESLGCALAAASNGMTTCRARSTNGAVSGAFVNAANGAGARSVRFTTTSPTQIVARSIDPRSGANTVTVGSARYVSDPNIASRASPGFQAVALSRDDLSLLYNQTFSQYAPQTSENLTSLASDITSGGLANEDVLWVIASIGNVQDTDTGMYQLSQAVAQIGGSFSVFNQLGTPPPNAAGCHIYHDYALIGWLQPDQAATGLAPGSGLEASGGVQCPTAKAGSAPTRSVTQQALVVPDERSFFAPQSSSKVPSSSGLQQAVLQGPSTSWPAARGAPVGTAPTAGQAAAYSYLSGVVETNRNSTLDRDVDHDLRYDYLRAVNTSVNDGGGLAAKWHGDLKNARYPANPYFTAQDFDGVRAELMLETDDLSNVATYATTILDALDDAVGQASLGYAQARTVISNTINPSGSTPVAADVASIFGTVVGDLLPIVAPGVGEAIGPAVDVICQSVSFGLSLTQNDQTGGPETALNDTYQNLVSDLSTLLADAQTGFQTAIDLAVTDYTRLNQTNAAVEAFQASGGPYGPPDEQNIATVYSNALASAAFDSLLGTLYKSVTLRALWGDKDPNVTTDAYPGAAQLPGGSIHRAVCGQQGTCPAEAAGHGLGLQPYFLSLANQPQPSEGNGSFFWQTTFMYLAGSCTQICNAKFPAEIILDILFDPAGTEIPVPQAGTIQAFGVWPGYLYGPGGAVPPISDPYSICGLAGTCTPGNQTYPGDESLPGATGPTAPPSGVPTAPPSAPAVPASGSGQLAATGPAVAPAALLELALLVLVLGLPLQIVGCVAGGGRHRRGRRSSRPHRH